MSSKAISNEELDILFDEGEQDITPYMKMSTLRRPDDRQNAQSD